MPKLWTPEETTTTLWLDASDSDSITIDTGVSRWADKSGNDNDAIQGTSSSQPVVTSNAINGLSVITFDGTNDWLETPQIILNCPTSLFMVIKTNTLVGSRTPLNQQYGNVAKPFQLYFENSGNLRDWRTGGYIDGIQSGVPFILSEIQITTSIIKFWNFGEASNDGSVSAGYAESLPIYLGKFQSYGPLGWHAGDIAEIILIDSAISDDDRQIIEGYLAHKWGLEDSLWEAHPYKTTPPYAPFTGYFDGYVYEQNEPVSRKLFLYNRDTGELLNSTTASGNGYYYLGTSYSGEHYMVCLDDDSGVAYSDLIESRLYPTGDL